MTVGRTTPLGAIINDQNTNRSIGNYAGLSLGPGLDYTDRGSVIDLESVVHGYETVHFRTGQVAAANLQLATPGTPAAASMAFFGQLNMPFPRTIRVMHLHLIDNGTSGNLTLEVYRRRSGTLTRLGILDATSSDGDFATIATVPAGDLALIEAGDYLFCQPTAKDLVTNGANGLTVDIHFLPPR